MYFPSEDFNTKQQDCLGLSADVGRCVPMFRIESGVECGE